MIENLLVECKKRALDLINTNNSYFKEVAEKLINVGEVSPSEMKDIATKYKIQLVNCSPEIKLTYNYDEKWLQYRGNH